MEINLTDDQEFFRDTTRRFLSTEWPLAKVREYTSSAEGFERDFWKRGAELGWTCLLIPEELGGGSVSGQGVVDLTIVADAFGRSVAPGPLLGVNAVAAGLVRSGTAEQQERVLPGIVSGDIVTAWCGAEHAVPSITTRTGPRAVLSGSEVTVSGASTPVEAGAQADELLVTARLDDGGLVQVLVPADAPGVTRRALKTLDLGRRYARVDFDGVTLPLTALVGDPASAADDVERQLQVALVVQLAEMAGAAEAAFDITLEWAFDRYTFGRPLASYQEIKHRFADMKTWLEASHALTTAAGRDVEAGGQAAAETVSIGKAYAGEMLGLLMQDCVQIHGGIGLTMEHDLHIFMRRVTVDRSTCGTPADHRQRIAAIQAANASNAA